MKNTNHKFILFFSSIILLLSGFSVSGSPRDADTLLVHYTVNQCDSLIQANANNPNFVILDVRTPGEYLPRHLTGAIQRDFYAANFDDLLDSLPKHKFYLVYCRSGSRSLKTFNLMVGKNFTQVVDMLGGINAWISASLPTTSDFAPLLMAVSETIIPDDTITIGTIDTMNLTVTNRANDTLRFLSITSLTGNEFSTDFDTEATLLGAEDYTFSLFYNPIGENSDSISFVIESNGGSVVFHVWRTGVMPLFNAERPSPFKLKVYSNAFSVSTTFEYILQHPENVTITVFNQLGKQIDLIQKNQPQGLHTVVWNSANIPAGVYYYRFRAGNQVVSGKMVVVR